MPTRDILTALLVVTILGSNFVAVKVGVQEIPPLLLTALRFSFAAVPAVFLIAPPRTSARLVVAFGLTLGVVQFGLLFTAIHLGMPAGLSSVVIQMQIFFTMALAYALFGERPTRMQIVGGGVSVVGVAMIGVFKAGGVEAVPFLLVLGAALAWGGANVITKSAGRIDMLAFVVWGSLVAPVPLLALSWLIEGPEAMAAALSHPSWRSIGAVAYLAYPTTLLAFALWTNLLSRHPAAAVTPFALLVPIAGVLSTHFVLGEDIGMVEIEGGALVLVGLLINILGSRKPRKSEIVKIELAPGSGHISLKVDSIR